MSDSVNATNAASKSEKKSKDTGKGSYWKGIKAEFRKIVWPDRSTLIKESTAVVVVSVVVGAIIAVIDRAVLYGINFLIK